MGIKLAADGVIHAEDLKKITVPTLFLHGDADQIVPIADAAMLAVKLVKNGQLKVYEGAPTACALPTRNRSMPTFLRSSRAKPAADGVIHAA